MKIPISSEKGAIEEIIWRVALELHKRSFQVGIYNPIASNTLSKIAASVALYTFLHERSILHFHDLISCISYVFAFRRNDKVVLLSLHYPPWITKSKERLTIMYHLLKYLKTRQVIFAAPSMFIVNRLRAELGVNVFFLPNGVDISLFNPNKRNFRLREKLLGNKEILICYVARIHPDKNHLDLLKAVRKLVLSGIKNFKVIFIGPVCGEFVNKKRKSSDYFSLLHRYIIKSHIEDYVEFAGELPRRIIAEYLASSDIYVHPSKVEAATPLAIIEAMASGLPVVAYNLVYYHGYLENHKNSILLKKGDVNGLANVLEALISQPHLRERLGMHARIFIEKNLSWEKVVENYYIPVYNGLIENTSK